MKILQVVGSINPNIGGKERFVGELARELLKLGHEVTIVICDKKYEADINCDIRSIQALNLLNVPPIPSFKELLEQLGQKFDICHLHYHAIFGEMVALVCKIYGLPLITTIHDEIKRGIHKIIYDRLLLGMISNLSNRIICLTNGMKKALIRRGLNEENVVIIPNAMHVKEFQNQAYKMKEDMYNEKEFDLLYVGRLEKRKGVQYLLGALSILKKEDFKPKLRIVGEGVYMHKLKSIVKDNDLSSQVVFTGYIPRKKLLNNYLYSKCVVIPSLYEGTPNRVAIEALALGKPVIITSIPGMEEITSKRLGFTVFPGDYGGLAKAICKILFIEDDELHRIGSEGKKFAEQYDWSRTIKQIIHLYQDCNENKHKPSF